MRQLLLFCTGLLLLSTLSAYSQSLDLDPALQPFYHGVASGDPLPDRVIIWTRVTPDQSSSEAIDVTWQVATDSGMTNVVQSGAFTTDADRDYTVKVDVTGLLPYTTYFYRFKALDATSITGRTRTTPTADEADRLRFAVVSCSNYQAGYFSAYKKVAERADLDAVIHLGDYIYEYSATGDDFYGNAALRDAGARNHLPDRELVDLADYRTRYSQYRLDPDLRAVHQQHPFITIWDDHESANDAYKDGAQNHQPDTEGPWGVRKSVSKQAYAEWIPIRVDLENEPLYRTIHYGNLVDLIMLDTRLEEREIQETSVTDAELYDPERTILGDTQKQWLYDQLQSSEAKWKVIGNQVIFSPFNVWFAGLDPNGDFTTDGIESIFLDIWDGYPAERDEIINFIGDNEIDNTVILTGDFHSSFAYDVTAQPSPFSGSDPSIAAAQQVPVPVTPTYDPATRRGAVAVEFATPSVNSANFDENIGAEATLGFEAQINQPLPTAVPGLGGVNPNPHMRFNDLDQHGYFILDVAEGRAQANWYFVNTILEPNSDEYFAAAWGANDGEAFLTEGEEDASKEFPTGDEPSSDSTLVAIAQGNPQFSILVEALVKTELAEVLALGGPFTVFAPTNDAFNALFRSLGVSGLEEVPADQLADILLYHVVAGTQVADSLSPGELLDSQQGAPLLIGKNGRGLTVNSILIAAPDVLASNGVIHVINRVLLPVNRVRQLVLVDAATNQDRGLLMDGDTISRADFPNGLSARALVDGPVGSVRFSLNDSLTRVENVLAFTLFEQQGNDYRGRSLAPGNYRVTATPYTMDDAQGSVGDSLTINFVVVDEPDGKTIVEIARETEDLSILVEALQRAGLVETLNGEGPFTVFAPTNEAFERVLNLLHLSSVDRLPAYILRKLLLYHVAKGELTSDTLSRLSRVPTLVGLPLSVSSEGATIHVNHAEVIAADIQASNGVVHLVDEVILPDLQALLSTVDEEHLAALNELLTPEGDIDPALVLSAIPNPGVEEVIVRIDGMAGETVSVRLVDSQGQSMGAWEYTVTGSQDDFALDLRPYTRGIYIVNVQVGELYEYVRVVK